MTFQAPLPICARAANWEGPTEADVDRCLKEDFGGDWIIARLQELKVRLPDIPTEALLPALLNAMRQGAFAMESASIGKGKVVGIVRTAATAARLKDALVVDDFFVQEYAYPGPSLVCDYIRIREFGGARSKQEARERGVVLTPERLGIVAAMLERAVKSTGLSEVNFNFDATFEHLDLPPCWHPKGHDEEPRRAGPKKKPLLRACVWGTYALSWLIGSETLAVRWWDRLVSPAEARWGHVATYVKAKGRLLDDLRGLTPIENPFEPCSRIDPWTKMAMEFAFGWR